MSIKAAVETSFGGMEFGRQTPMEVAVKMVQLCFDEGCYDFDTAYIYAGGKSEETLGNMELMKNDKVFIATKANPWGDQGLKYDSVIEQLNTSLERMKRNSVDLLYLHAPDHNTPIEETLKAVNQLHKEGKFKEFGLSNYSSWQVAEIYYICKENNYILPTVYQGMYNVLTRIVEKELFPCLRKFGIRFYAFNPLAGGLLTGKYQYTDKDDKQPLGRFFGIGGDWAKKYQDRFWHKSIFDTLDQVKAKLDEVYGKDEVSLTDAALRWMYHHSDMSGKYGDKVILGASNMDQLQKNFKGVKQGPLHQDILEIYDEAYNRYMKGLCADYFR